MQPKQIRYVPTIWYHWKLHKFDIFFIIFSACLKENLINKICVYVYVLISSCEFVNVNLLLAQCTVQCTAYTVHRILHNAQCTVYSVLCTLCIVYITQCIIYVHTFALLSRCIAKKDVIISRTRDRWARERAHPLA